MCTHTHTHTHTQTHTHTHAHSGIYSAIKMPFAAVWMDLESIVPSEINQTKTNTI